MAKISAQPAVTLPVLTDQFPVNQGGVTKRMPLSQVRSVGWFNVKDFGAVGNDVADDTAAIQAALDAAAVPTSSNCGGVVYIPRGKYKITSTLVMRDPEAAGFYSGTAIRGDGSHCTWINYVGSTASGVAALKVFGQTGTVSGGFALRNESGTRGSLAGLWFGGSAATEGTVCTGLKWDDLGVDQFFLGISIGDLNNGAHAASEVLFTLPKISNCDTGVLLQGGGGNSISVTFIHAILQECTVGVNTGQGFNIHVFGGSVAQCPESGAGAAFYLRGGTANIAGMWVETSYFLTQTAGQTHCSGMNIRDTNGTFGGYCFDLQGGKLTLNSCDIGEAFVLADMAGNASLVAINTDFQEPIGTPMIQGVPSTYAYGAHPLALSYTTAEALDRVAYTFIGCTGFGLNRIPDQAGYIKYNSGTSKFWQYGQGRLTTGQQTLFQTEADPTLAALSIGGGANGQAAQKLAGLYLKNGKLVCAFDNAGVLTFATLTLNGSATAWAQSTTPP